MSQAQSCHSVRAVSARALEKPPIAGAAMVPRMLSLDGCAESKRHTPPAVSQGSRSRTLSVGMRRLLVTLITTIFVGCDATGTSRSEARTPRPDEGKSTSKVVLVLGEPNTGASAPSSQAPVVASVTARPEQVSSGSEFELQVDVKIAPGHHVYAKAGDESRFAPLQLEVDLPSVLEPVGKARYPEATESSDGQPVYRDQVVVVQPLRFAPGATAATYELTVRMKYQVCNDLLCWPKESLEFTVPVVVESGG